jgi:hypothetical protein
MLQVAVGHSNDPDSGHAITEVLDQCRSRIGENQPQAGGEAYFHNETFVTLLLGSDC